MKAVVTGAAGFIGSRLATALLARGEQVLGIDRLSDYYEEALKRRNLASLEREPAFELAEADLAEADLAPLLEGADVAFHLAAQPGARGGWGSDFEIYLRDNVLATQRLLAGAVEAGVGRLVFASSSSVYGQAARYPTPESLRPRPISPYGDTKLAAEELCRLHATQRGLDAVILRYFTVFGPGQRPDMAVSRFLDATLEGRSIEVLGDGGQVRELTYVDDAVDATLAAAERGHPGAVYNVAGGTSVTVLGLVDAIGELVGRAPALTHLPEAPGDMRRTAGDTSLARAQLGFAPRMGLREGLERQLEALLGAGVALDRVPELLK